MARWQSYSDLPVENVHLIHVEGAGCYGQNGSDDAAADAVILAQAVGRPVRVQWTREDEFVLGTEISRYGHGGAQRVGSPGKRRRLGLSGLVAIPCQETTISQVNWWQPS